MLHILGGILAIYTICYTVHTIIGMVTLSMSPEIMRERRIKAIIYLVTSQVMILVGSILDHYTFS